MRVLKIQVVLTWTFLLESGQNFIILFCAFGFILGHLATLTSSSATDEWEAPAQFKIKGKALHRHGHGHLNASSSYTKGIYHGNINKLYSNSGGVFTNIKHKEWTKGQSLNAIGNKNRIPSVDLDRISMGTVNRFQVHPHRNKNKDKDFVIPGPVKKKKVKGNLTLSSTTSSVVDRNDFLLKMTDKMEKGGHLNPCRFNISMDNFRLNTPEILHNLGLPTETHKVRTADGYIFELHRIPRPGKRVVLAMPGVFQSSRDYLINCRGRSLGEKLYDADYDTWLGNYRGNTYGQRHARLHADSPEFWDFTGDDFSRYDAPATIDLILKVTNQTQLNYIGNSMGNGILLGLLSRFPDYNKKIHLGIAIGTAFYFGHTRSLLLRMLANKRTWIMPVIKRLSHGKIYPPHMTFVLTHLMSKICGPEATIHLHGLCTLVPLLFDGTDPSQTNHMMFPHLWGGLPSPTSWRVMDQWLQSIRSGEARMYDYGWRMNLLHYGKRQPPLYNLTRVTAPILIIYGENYYVTSIPDTMRLAGELRNLVRLIRVNFHGNNSFEKDVDLLVYDYILKYLKKSYTGSVSQAS